LKWKWEKLPVLILGVSKGKIGGGGSREAFHKGNKAPWLKSERKDHEGADKDRRRGKKEKKKRTMKKLRQSMRQLLQPGPIFAILSSHRARTQTK